jgi:hypothetical protein
MKFSLLGVGTLVTALNLVYGLGSAQTPEVVNTAIRSQLQQLGPEPMFAPPESLERLVKGADAAVIAEISEPGELKLVAYTSPGGTPLGPLGFASYRVVMREVIYNRLQNAAPSLTPGSTIELTQLVGRSEAAAFLARRIPVAPGDQCLLFFVVSAQIRRLVYPPVAATVSQIATISRRCRTRSATRAGKMARYDVVRRRCACLNRWLSGYTELGATCARSEAARHPSQTITRCRLSR